jgi:hypothetical protein
MSAERKLAVDVKQVSLLEAATAFSFEGSAPSNSAQGHQSLTQENAIALVETKRGVYRGK